MSEQSDKFYNEQIKKIEQADTKKKDLFERWEKLRNSYKGHSKSFAPIKEGFIFIRTLCPVCRNELSSQIISKGIRIYPNYIPGKQMYRCENCDYEYAYEDLDEFN